MERVRKFYAPCPTWWNCAATSHEARTEAEALAARARIPPGRCGPRSAGGIPGRRHRPHRRGNRKAGALRRCSRHLHRRHRRSRARRPRHHHLRAGECPRPPRPRPRARAARHPDAEGEYLPLALAFLSTQFRLALVAREAGLKSGSQVQSHFTKMGVPMWGSRADQVYQTAAKFGKAQLSAP